MAAATGATGAEEPSDELLERLHAALHFEQLRRLERYERRALSRRHGAIRILLDL
jgi:hypothetical protein